MTKRDRRPIVYIFARVPRMGRVKTRLAADIGPVAALSFYRTTLTGIARELAADPCWETRIAVTPDDGGGEMQVFAPQCETVPQGLGDLGQRMYRALCRTPGRPALIVGSDIPGIDRPRVWEAICRLRSHDLVFGPATDGGYWLVGAQNARRFPELFRGVRWSGPDALSDTIRSAGPNATVALTDELLDVDDGASYAAWQEGKT